MSRLAYQGCHTCPHCICCLIKRPYQMSRTCNVAAELGHHCIHCLSQGLCQVKGTCTGPQSIGSSTPAVAGGMAVLSSCRQMCGGVSFCAARCRRAPALQGLDNHATAAKAVGACSARGHSSSFTAFHVCGGTGGRRLHGLSLCKPKSVCAGAGADLPGVVVPLELVELLRCCPCRSTPEVHRRYDADLDSSC